MIVHTHGIPPALRDGVHFFVPPYAIGSVPSVSGTDGVHCRESAGTGPVVLKVVPVTGATAVKFAGHHKPINVLLSSPTPFVGMKYEVVIV